tara:strand:+ start:1031 stop:1255 length:225 start_codon:yes stop_codon:yes gene_type:complete
MSKLDQFKLFCTIQLQKIDQREIQLRREIDDLSIQREYMTEFLASMQGGDIFELNDFTTEEVRIFKSIMINKKN